MSRPDVPGRSGVWTVAVASLLLSCGLILSLFGLARGYHNPYASEPEVLMRAVLSVTLKWRVVVFWAEVIGLVGVLRVSRVWGFVVSEVDDRASTRRSRAGQPQQR